MDTLDNIIIDILDDLVRTTYLLNSLKTRDDLDNLISRFEKLEIIDENPIIYWALDKTYCKLEIINPDLTIKA